MLRAMPCRTRLRTLAFVTCITAALVPRVSVAEETSSANVIAARKHFDKARGYYAQGSYKEAITELEAAHSLDPNAKDLVFNLGLVHEKLANIDEALKWLRLYTTMDLTSAERDRADAYIRRLEGSRKEVEQRQATVPADEDAPLARSEPVGRLRPATRARSHPSQLPSAPGRIDGLTIGAASVSAAALVFGVVVGLKASKDRPDANSVAGRDGTAPELASRVHDAHREAVYADIGYGAALVAAGATAYLYFGRSRSAASPGGTTVSAAPFAGGGGLFVKGRF
jgi:tetratricopeptide (TPR) repeat protein